MFDTSRLHKDYIEGLSSVSLESFLKELQQFRLSLGFRSSCSIRRGAVVFDIDVDRAVLLGRVAMAEEEIMRRLHEV